MTFCEKICIAGNHSRYNQGCLHEHHYHLPTHAEGIAHMVADPRSIKNLRTCAWHTQIFSAGPWASSALVSKRPDCGVLSLLY